MARARGEHLPYLAYRLPGQGTCMACRAPVLARAAVIVGAPGGGSARVALCLDCQTRAFAAARRSAPVLWALLPKRCPHCARVWPRSPVAWHRNRTTRDGLEAWCKLCKAGDARARRRRRSWRSS